MMFAWYYRVPRNIWLILFVIISSVLITTALRITGFVEPTTYFYWIQPFVIAAVAGIAYVLGRGRRDRLRKKSERMFIVGAVLAIWFVVYFLSGLIFTYQNNALVTGYQTVAVNLFAFGVSALFMEYTRYKILLLAGRRNFKLVGSVVVVVFALWQMNLSQVVGVSNLSDFVKIAFVDFIPAIVSSLLLTYLAFTSGLGAMYVYRFGVVAITILPPVLPKHDWYLIGVGAVLLALAVYIAIEQTQREHERGRHPYNQVRNAYNGMVTIALVALVLFMTGVFTYRPYAIVSDSMVPVYSRGSMVVVQKVDDPMDISVGDIIQYEATGKMITHRVVAIDAAADGSGKRVFITKGDNVQSRDPLVAESQVRGIIRSQVPYVGYPSIWLREASVGAIR